MFEDLANHLGADLRSRRVSQLRLRRRQLAGHKTGSMLDRYNIVVERDLTDAGRKLTGTFTGTIGAFDLDPWLVSL